MPLKYSLENIAAIIGARPVQAGGDSLVEQLLLDSRKVFAPATSLFFALKGERRDGHQFIPEVYTKGVRSFVVSQVPEAGLFPGAVFLQVADPLKALQDLAAAHRQQFSMPVIGITGSNGKTIVKEWLYQLLHMDFNIVRSPKSYNSQVGVPLSVWQMNEQNTLGIFEAGISRPGEMERLERIIQPTIGVLTNIGEAHSEGFVSREHKEAEKRILFKHASVPPAITITRIQHKDGCTEIERSLESTPAQRSSIEVPFTDEASIENAVTCWRVMLFLGYKDEVTRERMRHLQPVNMRLELKKGINHCTIINDSYSADLSSLEIALNFLSQQSATQQTVILSDFLQSALPDETLYDHILDSLHRHGVKRLIGIGDKISRALSARQSASLLIELYSSTADFLKQFRSFRFREETILVKGARVFEFERIVQLLEQKVHQTVLEINLDAIAHNLKAYQRYLAPTTRVMAMVKAFAYGSGGAEIAGILQYHKVDYLGVAYVDEGIELRKSGIILPIMVMNPEESAFESLVEYNLEPDIYSQEMLISFNAFLESEGLQHYPVHLEIETGMNRLGFAVSEAPGLGDYFRKSGTMKIQSVFSHLAASEDPAEDEFTLAQFERYQSAISSIQAQLPYTFLKHIANTGAIFRLPQLQLDMVRLGIGLYGIDSSVSHQAELQPVATLKTTIAQVKQLQPGESVSYNRRGVVTRESTIATIRIGYADGFSRKLGNKAGKVWIRGKLAPVIGTVCMDMTMIDITGIEGVREGDEVTIFGRDLPISQLAQWAGTIPYEIMTSISQRVKRVYFGE
jgi:alanine racemase